MRTMTVDARSAFLIEKDGWHAANRLLSYLCELYLVCGQVFFDFPMKKPWSPLSTGMSWDGSEPFSVQNQRSLLLVPQLTLTALPIHHAGVVQLPGQAGSVISGFVRSTLSQARAHRRKTRPAAPAWGRAGEFLSG